MILYWIPFGLASMYSLNLMGVSGVVSFIVTNIWIAISAVISNGE
jgi:hypothetical protein